MNDVLAVGLWLGAVIVLFWVTNRALHVVPNAAIRFVLMYLIMGVFSVTLVTTYWAIFGYPNVGE